jgi:hypothetical protein
MSKLSQKMYEVEQQFKKRGEALELARSAAEQKSVEDRQRCEDHLRWERQEMQSFHREARDQQELERRKRCEHKQEQDTKLAEMTEMKKCLI